MIKLKNKIICDRTTRKRTNTTNYTIQIFNRSFQKFLKQRKIDIFNLCVNENRTHLF